jgi:SAM-dependent methyltransferase
VAEGVANVEQDEYWNAAEAVHWVDFQDRYDALLAPLDRHLLGAAEISGRDHVLDVGCGCGATSRAAARIAAAGDVLGIDLSAAMLERARAVAEAEALTNVRFLRGDAQVYEFGQSTFDVAISRFGVMFFADPVAAFANVARAVRDGGRLVFLCWQELLRNEWILVPGGAAAAYVPLPEPASPDEPGPFSLAEADRVRDILSAAGCRDVNIEGVTEPLRLGADADDTVAFLRGTGFARRLFEDVDDATIGLAVDAVREALTAYETEDGVVLRSAAWLVSARR